MKMKSFRFAAVAAVLLTFCLVFMAPVMAEGTAVANVGGTGYDNLQQAINNANDDTVGQVPLISRLS